jgi:hypothetical protein
MSSTELFESACLGEHDPSKDNNLLLQANNREPDYDENMFQLPDDQVNEAVHYSVDVNFAETAA